jgi:hypothetical protein
MAVIIRNSEETLVTNEKPEKKKKGTLFFYNTNFNQNSTSTIEVQN